MGELGFAVLLGFFFVSAHMLLEISMERAETRLERLWMHYLALTKKRASFEVLYLYVGYRR